MVDRLKKMFWIHTIHSFVCQEDVKMPKNGSRGRVRKKMSVFRNASLSMVLHMYKGIDSVLSILYAEANVSVEKFLDQHIFKLYSASKYVNFS